MPSFSSSATSLLFPWEFEESLDFEALFFRNRRWFFGTLALGWCIDRPETVMKGGADLRAVPESYFVFVGVLITLSVVGATTASRWYHRFFVVFWPVWVLSYLALTTLSEIATQG